MAQLVNDAFEVEDAGFAYRIGAVGVQIFFQLAELAFDVVEHQVITVDDVVDEGIGEVVGSFFAQAADAFAASVADEGERIVGIFLEGK